MQKAWVYKRKNRPGYYVLWYHRGRQRSRQVPNKTVAEQFRQKIERELNDDLYVEPTKRTFDELTAAHLQHLTVNKRGAGGTAQSYREVYRNFTRICGPVAPSRITASMDTYIAARTEEGTGPATINKDIRTLRALVNWAIKKKMLGRQFMAFDWSDLFQPAIAKATRYATVEEIGRLLSAAKELYGPQWRLRIVLAVTTGMRLRDVGAVTTSSIDLSTGHITGLNRKIYREGRKPLHKDAIPELRAYMASLPAGQTQLFPDKWHDSKWKRIKERAGVADLHWHHFRATTVSFVLQAGFSTSVAQNLVEHSTPNMTHNVYADVNPVYREAVDSIPLAKALSLAGPSEPDSHEPRPADPSGGSERAPQV